MVPVPPQARLVPSEEQLDRLLDEARKILRARVPANVSLSEELIADRRRDPLA